VHWPDGHTTKGLEKHIEDLKVMFTFAPDNRIREHPVRFGTADAEWTAVPTASIRRIVPTSPQRSVAALPRKHSLDRSTAQRD